MTGWTPSPRCSGPASPRATSAPTPTPAQFAYDLHGVMLAYHHASRLLGDPDAAARATRAFEALLLAARPAS